MTRRRRVGPLSVLVVSGGCTEDEHAAPPDVTGPGEPPAVSASPLRFDRVDVDLDANGPAFAGAGDINGDGKLDLVVTKFGHTVATNIPPGQVTAYIQGATVRE